MVYVSVDIPRSLLVFFQLRPRQHTCLIALISTRFFLCGFGYTLDLMWAHAFSLVTPRIQQEMGISDERYGDIFSGGWCSHAVYFFALARCTEFFCLAVFSAGLTVGALVWGILVDVIGRRWAFNLTVGVVASFGQW